MELFLPRVRYSFFTLGLNILEKLAHPWNEKYKERNANFSSDPYHLLPTKENESLTLFLPVICNAKKNVAVNTENYFYYHTIIRIEQFKNICNYLGSEM